MAKQKSDQGQIDVQQPWLVRHAALAYTNQWFMTDRGFLEELRPSSSLEISAEPIGRLAAKYMVARHFKKPKAGESDHRWTKVATRLKDALSSSAKLPVKIHVLAEQLGQVAPTKDGTEMNLLSAATKFLWFIGLDKVRILDKRAVAALSLLDMVSAIEPGYDAYETAWGKHFGAHEAELSAALKELPAQLKWSRVPLQSHSDAIAAFKTTAFKDRVFDKYLWTLGSKGGSFE